MILHCPSGWQLSLKFAGALGYRCGLPSLVAGPIDAGNHSYDCGFKPDRCTGNSCIQFCPQLAEMSPDADDSSDVRQTPSGAAT